MSRTTIRMGRCSVGRSTQKYTGGGGGGADLSSILAGHGDMIYANQNIEAANVSIGQTTGHVLTVIAPGEVGWQGVSGASGQVGTLQSVTTNASTTDIETGFLNTVTSLTASGNVLVTGNVTASKFIGSGLELTGVALATDLNSNSSRISDIETCTTGDILYASATNTLSKLAIGGVGQVLKSDGTVPVWGTDVGGSSGGGVWSDSGINGKIYYNSGSVGINTASPQYTLDVHGTANVGALTVVSVSGDGSGLTNIPGSAIVGGVGSALWNDDAGKIYYTDGPVGIGNTQPLTTQTLQIGSNVSINDLDDDKLVVSGNVYIARALRAIDLIESYEVRANFFTVKNIDIRAERPRRGVSL
jgi:hypothetical protein